MGNNVAAERVYGLGSPQDCVEAAHGVLAALRRLLVVLVGVLLVCPVELLEGVGIEVQGHNAALVVDRHRRLVLHRLGHVVDVDVASKHLLGVPAVERDRRASEADVGGVRKGVAHLLGRPDGNGAVVLDGLGEPVLSAVRLVDHHHNVAAAAERLVALRELLHGGEDDAVSLPALQEPPEVIAGGRLHRRLAQEGGAPGELAEQLVVEVVPVGNDHDRGAIDALLEHVGEKDHRERLARALRVPEDADPAVTRDRLHGTLRRLVHPEVLVVRGQNLDDLLVGVVEANEVAQDVAETVLAEHAVDGCLPARVVLRVVAVEALPLAEAVLGRGDGAHLCRGHVRHDQEGVGDEEGGDRLEVVPQLQVGVRGVRLLAGGALQLEDHEGHPVHEHDDVGALPLMLHERPLVNYLEGVVLRPLVVDEADDVVPLLLAVEEADFHAGLNIAREALVALSERPRLDIV